MPLSNLHVTDPENTLNTSEKQPFKTPTRRSSAGYCGPIGMSHIEDRQVDHQTASLENVLSTPPRQTVSGYGHGYKASYPVLSF